MSVLVGRLGMRGFSWGCALPPRRSQTPAIAWTAPTPIQMRFESAIGASAPAREMSGEASPLTAGHQNMAMAALDTIPMPCWSIAAA